jgi:hypothetical protein
MFVNQQISPLRRSARNSAQSSVHPRGLSTLCGETCREAGPSGYPHRPLRVLSVATTFALRQLSRTSIAGGNQLRRPSLGSTRRGVPSFPPQRCIRNGSCQKSTSGCPPNRVNSKSNMRPDLTAPDRGLGGAGRFRRFAQVESRHEGSFQEFGPGKVAPATVKIAQIHFRLYLKRAAEVIASPRRL